MKKIFRLVRILSYALCGCFVLGSLGACSGGESVHPASGANEVYVSPANEKGKPEFTLGDATIFHYEWEPAEGPVVEPDISDPSREEVYLSSNETDTGKFEYLDENGSVVAVWEVLPVIEDEDFIMRPSDKDVWGLGWELYPGRVYTAEETLEPKDGIITVYFSFHLSSTEGSYLGYFNSTAERYTWLEPPNDEDYYLKLTVNSTDAISIALKHDSNEMIKYTGQYRLTPAKDK